MWRVCVCVCVCVCMCVCVYAHVFRWTVKASRLPQFVQRLWKLTFLGRALLGKQLMVMTETSQTLSLYPGKERWALKGSLSVTTGRDSCYSSRNNQGIVLTIMSLEWTVVGRTLQPHGLHQLLDVIAQDKPLIVVQVSSYSSRNDSRIVCFVFFKCIEG